MHGLLKDVAETASNRDASTALLVSMQQILLKRGGKLIALALSAKKQFLPIGL